MNACRRCPHKPIGCWPDCELPSATWASNSTTDPPPKWVEEWELYMDIAAARERELLRPGFKLKETP